MSLAFTAPCRSSSYLAEPQHNYVAYARTHRLLETCNNGGSTRRVQKDKDGMRGDKWAAWIPWDDVMLQVCLITISHAGTAEHCGSDAN